jgi:hypothetical protein
MANCLLDAPGKGFCCLFDELFQIIFARGARLAGLCKTAGEKENRRSGFF